MPDDRKTGWIRRLLGHLCPWLALALPWLAERLGRDELGESMSLSTKEQVSALIHLWTNIQMDVTNLELFLGWGDHMVVAYIESINRGLARGARLLQLLEDELDQAREER